MVCLCGRDANVGGVLVLVVCYRGLAASMGDMIA